jgi:hypothetical protein
MHPERRERTITRYAGIHSVGLVVHYHHVDEFS